MTHPSNREWSPDDDPEGGSGGAGSGGEFGGNGGGGEPDDAEYEDEEWPLGPVSKPTELLALHDVTTELFATLRRWFDVPATVSLDLAEVDSAVSELGDPQMVAALAMRKLQALHLLATPGVRTATDVVVAIVNDLERALVQAPNMWLKRTAAATDWDQALAALSSGETEGLEEAPVEADEVDPEVLRFRTLHAALHDAMFAVIEASEGEIRELE
jgi:hypothetical protein